MQQVRADRTALADLQLAFATFRCCHRISVARWLSKSAIPASGVSTRCDVGTGRAGDNGIYDWFRYDVVRVWRQPVAAVLDCGLTVLPLAPICDVVPEQVPGVLMAISARLEQEASAEQASTLWNATRILMGLRYEVEQVDAIIEGVTAMLFGIRGIEESSVYQGILRKGEAKGLAEGEAKGLAEGEAKGLAKGRAEGEARGIRQALLIHGRRKLGPPDEETSTQIAEIHDLDRLRLLLERILDVSSWDELLAPDDASA
jgi:hypothetical protein